MVFTTLIMDYLGILVHVVTEELLWKRPKKTGISGGNLRTGIKMSKFELLKDPSAEDTFTGVKFADQYTESVPTEDGMAIIQGFPACPQCGVILSCEFTAQQWCCAGCHTRWNKASLIEALQNERAVAKLYGEEDNEGLVQ